MALNKTINLSEELMRHVRTVEKSDRLFLEIINKKESLNKIVSEIKNIQWRIANYSILLFGVLFGIAKILNIKTFQFAVVEYLVLGVLSVLIWFFAMNMLLKTTMDLRYYRKHMELNEIIEDELTGLVFRSNDLVNELLDNDKRSKFNNSSKENMINFTIPFVVIITIGLLLTLLIDIYFLVIV